tara:strand:- start:16869 stop:17468 length:600 start_codon:yes stop_codon:yes gene_type:complete
MALIVQKYGGTSVGTPERIGRVASRVAKFCEQGQQVVVTVSAMSGETSRLIALSRAVSSNPDPRELDVVVSTGEQVTIGLLCMALQQIGIRAKSYTGGQVRILTDSAHTRARILSIDEASIRKDLAQGMVVGVPDKPGIAYQILGPVAEANIDVVMIIRNVGKDGCTDLSFTVGRADLDKALALRESVRSHGRRGSDFG